MCVVGVGNDPMPAERDHTDDTGHRHPRQSAADPRLTAAGQPTSKLGVASAAPQRPLGTSLTDHLSLKRLCIVHVDLLMDLYIDASTCKCMQAAGRLSDFDNALATDGSSTTLLS